MTDIQPINNNIRKVIALCNEMLELADFGDDQGLDEDCNVFYGALRDSAYKIRRLAKNELIRHMNGNHPSTGDYEEQTGHEQRK